MKEMFDIGFRPTDISNFQKISRDLQSTTEHQSAWRQVPISRGLVILQNTPEIFQLSRDISILQRYLNSPEMS